MMPDRFDESVPGRFRGSWAVIRRNLRVWRRFFWAAAAGDLAEPLLYLIALGYGLGSLVGDIDGMSYMRFLAPGLVVTACLYSASFEGTYGSYTRLEPQRTFEAILATPIGVAELVLAEIGYAAIKSFVAGSAVLLVVSLMGLTDSRAVLAVPLLCAVCGVLFGAMAVLVSSLSPSYDFFNYYFTLVLTPLLLFSGIFFPLEQLPDWAQTAACFSPVTHAAGAAHALFAGRLDLDLLANAAFLLLAMCLPLWPAVHLFKRRLIK